jgi:hypothetical protein
MTSSKDKPPAPQELNFSAWIGPGCQRYRAAVFARRRDAIVDLR